MVTGSRRVTRKLPNQGDQGHKQLRRKTKEGTGLEGLWGGALLKHLTALCATPSQHTPQSTNQVPLKYIKAVGIHEIYIEESDIIKATGRPRG